MMMIIYWESHGIWCAQWKKLKCQKYFFFNCNIWHTLVQSTHRTHFSSVKCVADFNTIAWRLQMYWHPEMMRRYSIVVLCFTLSIWTTTTTTLTAVQPAFYMPPRCWRTTNTKMVLFVLLLVYIYFFFSSQSNVCMKRAIRWHSTNTARELNNLLVTRNLGKIFRNWFHYRQR